MKQLITFMSLVCIIASCKTRQQPMVSEKYIDSLVMHYSDSADKHAIETDIQFWQSRINPKMPGYVNELRYAAALVRRFHLTGKIEDILVADSILKIADSAFAQHEPAPNMALVRNYILQHRFKEADSVFNRAKEAGLKPYERAATAFDVAFELGYYGLAETELNKIRNYSDYGFNFRKAKMAHYQGLPDTAIAAMHRAFELAGNDISLQQAALSNEADLNLHTGNLNRAAELYMQSLQLRTTDLHSIIGLGWIALVHDRNDSLAEKIFRFVNQKTNAPDALLKLAFVAEACGDSTAQRKYAMLFAKAATQPVYGNMYTRYLLQLYTGILHDPQQAEILAGRDVQNRATPQTYAWLVWALHCNNKTDAARKIYKEHVSGKPLEGLELYWMGKYMEAGGNGYNASQYFKAAKNNKYDLSPAMINDLTGRPD